MSSTKSQPERGSAPRTPVFASIAARIRELAAAEGLDAGDRLPPERELSRILGVSRTSLREALTALRIEGLVEVQHGNGMYLLRSPTETIPPIAADLARRHPELPALGAVRNTLEALAAELAAGSREDHDLARMVEAVRAMDAAIAAGEDGIDGDRMFHAAILAAARNPVLTDLLQTLASGASQIASASLGRAGQPPRSLTAHRLILDAIIVHDADLARQLMREHLDLTGEMLAAG
ncbi:MAG TPA: FCD domain-containing protein [Solirubrobacteraceae bacterium]|nr:FCD domain-containing protein [Solirubrobacteraceae bacterium]